MPPAPAATRPRSSSKRPRTPYDASSSHDAVLRVASTLATRQGFQRRCPAGWRGPQGSADGAEGVSDSAKGGEIVEAVVERGGREGGDIARDGRVRDLPTAARTQCRLQSGEEVMHES